MKSYYVYILLCADNSYYVGQTDDLEKRMIEHSTKLFDGYTSSKLPVTLVYQTAFSSRSEALAAEKKIKKWSRDKKCALVEGKFVLRLAF